jgi:hypothetical protein
MSFVRPEALEWLRRAVEPGVTGAVAIWLGALAVDRLAGSPLIAAALMIPAVGAAAWCATAVMRLVIAQASGSRVRGPGLVTVEEGRIGYFGPLEGGFVSLDQLVAVSVLRDDRADGVAFWIFDCTDGSRLAVPGGADGAGRLPDMLSGLPGFDSLSAVRMLSRRQMGRTTIWKRVAESALRDQANHDRKLT